MVKLYQGGNNHKENVSITADNYPDKQIETKYCKTEQWLQKKEEKKVMFLLISWPQVSALC